MKQYIDKAALVTEIESKIKEWRLVSSSEAKFRIEAYKELSEWLDTLEVKEEPVSKDLDEAARKAGQKYFPDEYNIWARPNYEAVKVEYAFKEGAKWQEEHLIDKACEWLKSHYRDYMYNPTGERLEAFFGGDMCNDFENYMMEK